MRQTFGIDSDGRIPAPPSQETQSRTIEDVAEGAFLPKPFLYDWSSPPTTVYNRCIEDAFCADFWLSVMGGAYTLSQIPPRYQREDGFLEVLRTHVRGLRSKWMKTQKTPLSASQEVAIAQRNARVSRVATVRTLERFPCRERSYLPFSFFAIAVQRLHTFWNLVWENEWQSWSTTSAHKVSALTRKCRFQVAVQKNSQPSINHGDPKPSSISIATSTWFTQRPETRTAIPFERGTIHHVSENIWWSRKASRSTAMTVSILPPFHPETSFVSALARGVAWRSCICE